MLLILLQAFWFMALVFTSFFLGHFLFFFKGGVLQNFAIKLILGFCVISIGTSAFFAGLTYTNLLLTAALVAYLLLPKESNKILYSIKARSFGLFSLPVFAFFYFAIFSVKGETFYVNFIDFSYYGTVAEGLVNTGVENTYAYLNNFNADFFPSTQLYHFADLWVVGLLAMLSNLPAATLYLTINCSFFLMVFFVFAFEVLFINKKTQTIDWWVAPMLVFSGVALYYFSKGFWMVTNIVSDPELKFLPSFVMMLLGLWSFRRNEKVALLMLFISAIFNILFLPIFGFFVLRNLFNAYRNSAVKNLQIWIPSILLFAYGLSIFLISKTYALQSDTVAEPFSFLMAFKSLRNFSLQSFFLLPYFGLILLLVRNNKQFKWNVFFGGIVFSFYILSAAFLYNDLQNFQLFFVARLFVIAVAIVFILNRLPYFYFKFKVPVLAVLIIFAFVPLQKTYAKWQRSNNHELIQPHAEFLKKHHITTSSLVFKSPSQYSGAHQLAVHAMDGISAHLPYTPGNSGIVDLGIYHYMNASDFIVNPAYLSLNNCMGITQSTSKDEWICNSLEFIAINKITSSLVAADAAAIATFNMLKPQLNVIDSMYFKDKFTLYYWDQVKTLCAE